MGNWRDMSVAYTEKEIQEIIEACRAFPDFKEESISSADFVPLMVAMRYERTAHQLKTFQDYYDKHCGGRVSLVGLTEILRAQHKPSLHSQWYAKEADKNNDGIISKVEYEQIFALMSVQWPGVAAKSYDDFLAEADTDKSGDVNVDEYVAWLVKHCD